MAEKKAKSGNILTDGTLPAAPDLSVFEPAEQKTQGEEGQQQEQPQPQKRKQSAPREQGQRSRKKDAQETLVRLSVVVGQAQADKLIALKLEYLKRFRRDISDSEIVRRLIEQSTIGQILTPTDLDRSKAKS